MGDGLSDVANPYTYTGRQFDAESGIYQYRYRYYHAQLGRFVGRDLKRYIDGLNLMSLYKVLLTSDPFGTEVCPFEPTVRLQSVFGDIRSTPWGYRDLGDGILGESGGSRVEISCECKECFADACHICWKPAACRIEFYGLIAIDRKNVLSESVRTGATYESTLAGVYGHEVRHIENMFEWLTKEAGFLKDDLLNAPCSTPVLPSRLEPHFGDLIKSATECEERKLAIMSAFKERWQQFLERESMHIVDEDGPAAGHAYPDIEVPPPTIDDTPITVEQPGGKVDIPPDIFK